MIGYTPGSTIVHRLDPRGKLAVQLAFAIAAFAHTTPRGLAALTIVVIAIARLASVSVVRVILSVRVLAPFLIAAPLVAAIRLSPPAIDPSAAVQPALASYRVLLVFVVAAAYVNTTPVRASRAAIQRTIPGRPGVLLGVGVSLVFRFLPVLRRELTTARAASVARLGTERALVARIRRLVVVGVNRSFTRADRLSVALAARCFAWNPTLPQLSFTRLDIPVFATAIGLLVAAVFV